MCKLTVAPAADDTRKTALVAAFHAHASGKSQAQVRIKSARLLATLAISLMASGATTAWAGQSFELGIEHNEVLPSVTEDVKPGKRFSLSLLENQDASNQWIKLPAWMCGTWAIGRETAVLRKDFKKNETIREPYTYNARNTFQYGMQKDRQGDVWHYIGTPYTSKTSLAIFDEYHHVREKRFMKADQSEVSFTTVMTVVRVKSSQTIDEVFQQESITVYTPNLQEGPEFINLSASTKSFDADGSPWRQSDNIAKIKKKRPFAEVTHYHGQDMKKLFREFLIANGLSNLLPD